MNNFLTFKKSKHGCGHVVSNACPKTEQFTHQHSLSSLQLVASRHLRIQLHRKLLLLYFPPLIFVVEMSSVCVMCHSILCSQWYSAQMNLFQNLDSFNPVPSTLDCQHLAYLSHHQITEISRRLPVEASSVFQDSHSHLHLWKIQDYQLSSPEGKLESPEIHTFLSIQHLEGQSQLAQLENFFYCSSLWILIFALDI